MDKAQVIKWVAGIVARGVAWILAAKFGLAAAESVSMGEAIAQALAALAIAGVSIYTSVKGRNVLLNTPAPGSPQASGTLPKP